MGWLEDRQCSYKYTCDEGHLSVYQMPTSEQDYESTRECLACQKTAAYSGFEPDEINMVGKVSFDQNGRKAYRISDGKGKVTYISQTKYKYMQTGKIEPQYTKEYESQIHENEVKNAHLIGTDHNRRMANVTKAIADFKSEEA